MTRPDLRRSSPAAQRNKAPLLEVIRAAFPATGLALEVASGSGEHAAWFARALPGLVWQPSEPSPEARASAAAWAAAEALPNLRSPLDLDAAAPAWPIAAADAILCVNMIHISPWAATLGLLDGAARLLPPGAPLLLYGPYRRDGIATAPRNEAFDADLRRRDPRWGLRRLEDVAAAADARGLAFAELAELPANNVTVLFRRRPPPAAAA